MTLDNPTNRTNPWTPGPWAIDGDSCGAGVTAVEIERDENGHYVRRDTVLYVADYGEGERDWSMPNRRADLALIALAPEMAGAILAWRGHKCGEYCMECDAIEALSEQLRAIGEPEAVDHG